ncbi:MAG: restriction endonuclease [Patescibacteria group bacterium]
MAIPDYQSLMLPILELASDKKEHSIREAIDGLSEKFGLSDAEKTELLPSGQQYVFENRVGWARTYLKKAGLLNTTKRSYFQISDEGIKVLDSKPKRIDAKYLTRFPQFLEFKTKKKERVTEHGWITQVDEIDAPTPQEFIELGYQKIRDDLAQDILTNIKNCTPKFFEKLVVELLLKMGYGGSRIDAGEAIGQSGDGGIDGIIKEDRLGLDVIYLQAKRWEGVVGSKEIRNFVGSLVGKKATKGVFLTTSDFTKDAKEYIETVNHKVVLIDGEKLTQLMFEFNLGLQTTNTYEIKRIDVDYFSEE